MVECPCEAKVPSYPTDSDAAAGAAVATTSAAAEIIMGTRLADMPCSSAAVSALPGLSMPSYPGWASRLPIVPSYIGRTRWSVDLASAYSATKELDVDVVPDSLPESPLVLSTRFGRHRVLPILVKRLPLLPSTVFATA